MLYANTNKINWIILLACITSFIVSPSYNQKIVQAKSEEKTNSGMEWEIYAPVQSSGTIDRKKDWKWLTYSGKLEDWKATWISKKNTDSNPWTLERWVEYKIDKLIEVGIIPEIAESLVTNCKALADDPRKCVLVWASIVTAESSWWKNCRKNNQYNCFWIMQNNNYKSYDDATLHFAWKFQKWWRNAKSMEFFYPKRWETSPSRYCVSEHSSNSSKWCENWLKNSSAVFNKLNKLF